jgi:hypothetical protein
MRNKVTVNATANERKIKKGQAPAYRTHTCVFVRAAQGLLEGEEEIDGQIEIEGTCNPYTVTSLGRYKFRSKYIEKNIPQPAEGKGVTIWTLVLLASTGLTKRPVVDGETLTVDHIHGRNIPFPHRPSNLRWATSEQQRQNRVALGELSTENA